MEKEKSTMFNKSKLHLKIIVVLLLILIFLRVSLMILNQSFKIYILFESSNQDEILKVFNIFFIVILLVYVILKVFKNHKSKVLSLIAIIVVLLIILLNVDDFFEPNHRYFYFDSPHGETILVVEESSWLQGGWTNFYKELNHCFVRKLDSHITTDDGFRPFSNGRFEIIWINDSTIELSYYFGNNNIIKNEKIIVK